MCRIITPRDVPRKGSENNNLGKCNGPWRITLVISTKITTVKKPAWLHLTRCFSQIYLTMWLLHGITWTFTLRRMSRRCWLKYQVVGSKGTRDVHLSNSARAWRAKFFCQEFSSKGLYQTTENSKSCNITEQGMTDLKMLMEQSDQPSTYCPPDGNFS